MGWMDRYIARRRRCPLSEKARTRYGGPHTTAAYATGMLIERFPSGDRRHVPQRRRSPIHLDRPRAVDRIGLLQPEQLTAIRAHLTTEDAPVAAHVSVDNLERL